MWLGSIKSNMATAAADGVAAVIKMVMAMRAGCCQDAAAEQPTSEVAGRPGTYSC